jgi:cation diffusion facilitator CzcD-associated flavoprotein CzcO
MSNGNCSCRFAVVGAGPYGLAVASHLRAAGFDVRIFGKAMEFWERQMPAGMRVRSPREGTHIADPYQDLTLDKYEAVCGVGPAAPLMLEDFVRYGQWFQRQCLPDLDERSVARIEPRGEAFHLTLEDGDLVRAQRVIVATGIGAFAHYPAPFAPLPRELVSHTSERNNHHLDHFSGRRVLVVGGGQSALESAALLHEAGAEVEVVLRRLQVRWLRHGTPLHTWLHSKGNPFRQLLYPPGDIGPPVINWLIEMPRLFQLLPRRLQDRLAAWAIRPAASGWLRSRTQGVTITTQRQVVSASRCGDQLEVQLDDGSVRSADHVLLGTGYRVSIDRYRFLPAELLGTLRTVNGYPVLTSGFESSLPGLYFVGATAAYSFGPVCRFVAGTPFTARALTRSVVAARTRT